MSDKRQGSSASQDAVRYRACGSNGPGPTSTENLFDEAQGRLVFAMAMEAVGRREFEVARRLLDGALAIEDSSGRRTGDLVTRVLREMAKVEIRLGWYGSARGSARRLAETALAATDRRAGQRLVARSERLADERGSRTMGNNVGGHALFSPEPIVSTITFADVGGMGAVKNQIYRAGILPLRDPECAEFYGVRAGGAILLSGPPGCGKTLIALAAAGEMEAPLFVVNPSDIMHPLMGMDERNLAEVFKAVRRHPKSVLFFDELDAIAPVRTESTVEARRSLMNSLLLEIDGARPLDGCLIIGATNAPELIDPAMMRRGRFDKCIYAGLPDSSAREAIFRVKLAQRPTADGIDFVLLTALSGGLTGADIDGVVRDAAEEAWAQCIVDRVKREIQMLDLLIALSQSRVDGKTRNLIQTMIDEGWSRSIS